MHQLKTTELNLGTLQKGGDRVKYQLLSRIDYQHQRILWEITDSFMVLRQKPRLPLEGM